MPDQVTVINIDKVVDAFVASHTQHLKLSEELGTLKAQLTTVQHAAKLEEKKLDNEGVRDKHRYDYLTKEATRRTIRFVVLVGVAWGIVSCNGETLRQLFRPPAPTADFVQRFAALVDVTQSEKRVENIKQLRKCVAVASLLLPPAAGASGPGAPGSAPVEKTDTRISDGEKHELRSACKPLIEP